MFVNGTHLGNESIKKLDCYTNITDQKWLIGPSAPMHHMAPEPRCTKVSCMKKRKKINIPHIEFVTSFSFSHKVYVTLRSNYKIAR